MSAVQSQGTAQVTFRDATPADSAFLAQIDYEASQSEGETFWKDLLDVLGDQLMPFLTAMYRANANAWSPIERTVVLEVDGVPAGAAALLEPDMTQALPSPLDLSRLPAMAADLGWDRAKASALEAAYLRAWGTEPMPFLMPQASAQIEVVAVLPQFRGQGLGKRLLEELFRRARARGHQTIGIMVIVGNEPAHRLYTSVGFQPYVTYHAAYFKHEFPGVVKFIKPL